MKLSEMKVGERIIIKTLPKGDVKSQAIRLGMFPGAEFECYEAIKNGPVVLKSRMQQIAIGRKLADKIEGERIGGIGNGK